MVTLVLCVLSFISGGVTVYLTLRDNPKLKNTVDGITDVISRNQLPIVQADRFESKVL